MLNICTAPSLKTKRFIGFETAKRLAIVLTTNLVPSSSRWDPNGQVPVTLRKALGLALSSDFDLTSPGLRELQRATANNERPAVPILNAKMITRPRGRNLTIGSYNRRFFQSYDEAREKHLAGTISVPVRRE